MAMYNRPSQVRHPSKLLIVVFGLLILGLAALALKSAYSIIRRPTIKTVTASEVGAITNPNRPGLLRDGGASGLVGGRVLWTFGDTLFSPKSVDGVNLRSNTAGYAEVSTPTVVSESLDAKRAPVALLPFTADEQNFNTAQAGAKTRYALWPTAVVPESDSSSIVLYTRLKVMPGNLNYQLLGTGAARVTAGQTVATRLTDSLFTGDDLYGSAVVHAGNGSAQAGGYVYVYSCATSGKCKVARTPQANLLDPSSYTYWTGRDWSADAARAKATVPGSTSGFSVSYNAYLKSFVSYAHAGPFSKSIVVRTAPAPEGPWSEPKTVYTASNKIYAVTDHPELAQNGGQDVFVSYYDDLGGFKGQLKLIKLHLEK